MYATYVLLIRTQPYLYFLAKRAVQAHETGREAAAFSTWWSLLDCSTLQVLWYLFDLVYLVLKYKYTMSISIK